MRLLLIEDDAMISRALQVTLQRASYTVDTVATVAQAMSVIQAQPYDLLLLDLNLPDGDGITFLKKVRQLKFRTPILILSARDTVDDRLVGLDNGADDYLVKPFSVDELLARIRAILRRSMGQANGIIGEGSLRLNLNSQTVFVGEKFSVELTAKECALLQALLLNQGRILSRSKLEDKLYGFGAEVESNAVDFLIHALRKKIGKNHIKNIRGAGWMIPK